MSLLGPTAGIEFNRYVVLLGLPALLFEVMAGANWAVLWRPGFIAAFTLGSFGIFGLTLIVRVWKGSHLADATIDGLNAGYANAGFVGFPLCEAVFGRQSLPLATIAAVLTVCVLFAVALIIVEISLQTEARPHHVALKVSRTLARNPLLIAPVAGVAWSATGIAVPAAIDTFIHMIGASATPCALMSLGLFLAVKRPESARPSSAPLVFTGLKLVAQPAITGLVAFNLLRLPTEAASLAVLMASMPTGTGPFMLAEYYNRDAVATSHTILLSTAASVFTLAVCIYLIR
jgi:predicted permease